MYILALLFIVVPLIEISLLARIAAVFGVLSTLALCVGTGLAGAALARREGIRTLTRVQRSMAEGRMPENELVDGMLILLAGAVLLTPGVLTDCFGFLLLVPWGRAWIKQGAVRALRNRVHVGGAVDRGFSKGSPKRDAPSRRPSPNVVDVDFTVKDDE